MRKPVKYRLLFIITAIIGYVFGSKLLPEQLEIQPLTFELIQQSQDWQTLLLVSVLFFVVLPLLYWFWVIKAGQQPKWKLIMVFSLSSLVARFQYPAQFAEFFEFITWLKYPILAILLVVEIYLLVTIVRALWQARSLSGDPRVHMIEKYLTAGAVAKPGDSTLSKSELKQKKELDLALLLAHEPASWYYAIPRFTRNHVKALASINLMSASIWHCLAVNLGLVAITTVCYMAIASWSETVAIVVASIVFYSIIMLIANYRASRHFSLYELEGKLVINNSWWGFMVIDKLAINACKLGTWSRKEEKEELFIGRGDANLELVFDVEQSYFSGLASMNDKVNKIYLSVDEPQNVVDAINTSSSELSEQQVA
mgnify:CR=1 FL=1